MSNLSFNGFCNFENNDPIDRIERFSIRVNNRDELQIKGTSLMRYIYVLKASDFPDEDFVSKLCSSESLKNSLSYRDEAYGANILHICILAGNNNYLYYLLNNYFDYLVNNLSQCIRIRFPESNKTATYTPLMLAAKLGLSSIVGTFCLIFSEENKRIPANMYYKPFMDARESDKMTAFHIAAANNKSDCISVLAFAYKKIISNPSYKKSKNNNIDIDCYGRTPLHLAAFYGYVRCVQLILHFAENFAGQVDDKKYTAIQYACIRNHPKVVNELALNRYEINRMYKVEGNTLSQTDQSKKNKERKSIQKLDKKFKSNSTALMMAAREGHSVCVKILVRSSQVGKQDDDGMTALMYAAQQGHSSSCDILINSEANLCNNENRTAFELAAEAGHIHCLNSLIKGERGRAKEAYNLAKENGHYHCAEKINERCVLNKTPREVINPVLKE